MTGAVPAIRDVGDQTAGGQRLATEQVKPDGGAAGGGSVVRNGGHPLDDRLAGAAFVAWTTTP